MLNYVRTAAVVAVATTTILFALSADANALYFERVLVQTSSEGSCFRFADNVAHTLQFRNVHKNPLEVAGERNGAYVAMTCIGRGQVSAMAVVMAVSSTFEVARQVGTEVAGHLKRITCIDSPC